MSTTALTPARAVWLVARREIVTRVRSKGFVAGTLVMLLMIAAYVGFVVFVRSADSHSKVGVTGQASAVTQTLVEVARAFGHDVDVVRVDDARTGELRVREGDLDALVTGTPSALRVVVKRDLDAKLREALNAVVQREALDARLRQAGLDPAQVRLSVANAKIAVTTLEPVDPERGQRMAVALTLIVLMYGFLLTYGMGVAQGVVEEKASRVVELLLATVRPWQLLLGKIIGIGFVGLLQMLIVGGLGLGAALGSGVLTVSLRGAFVESLLSGLAWYLLGYFLFATLFAAAGALVSRQEEIGMVVQPIMVMIIIPFVIGVTLLPRDPDSRLLEVLSLLPPFTPVLMAARTAAGVAPMWQVGLSVVLTFAAIGAIVPIAGRVYFRGVLWTGGRLRLRQALASA